MRNLARSLEIVPGADGAPVLRADVRDENGIVRPGSTIELTPSE